MPVDPPVLVLALAVTVAAGLVQGTIGFGLSVVSVPVLSLLDRDLAPVPQLLITLALALAIVWREWRHLDLSGVGWVLVGRLPGAALGVVLLKTFADTALDALVAALVLIGVAIVGSGVVIRLTPFTKITAGVASGTMGLVASIGGPPLALLYRDVKGGTMRSSLNAIFAIWNHVLDRGARRHRRDQQHRHQDRSGSAAGCPRRAVAEPFLHRPDRGCGPQEGGPVGLGVGSRRTASQYRRLTKSRPHHRNGDGGPGTPTGNRSMPAGRNPATAPE